MSHKRFTSPPKAEATEPVIDRRSFMRGVGSVCPRQIGGLGLAWLIGAPLEEQVAYASQRVNRNSRPSELKITDLRTAVIAGAPMRVPIIRIDTNQDISGYGEVRDGGDKRYALLLKSRLLGVELNEQVVREHLAPREGFFEPTPQWNKMRSNDRLWS